MEKKCQFIEECFAASIHCSKYLEENCYQADLMKIKLNQAKNLPCPLAPNLKCDICSRRALLDKPEDCTINNKCKIRETLPNIPADKFEDAKRISPKIELSGMAIMRELNKLSV